MYKFGSNVGDNSSNLFFREFLIASLFREDGEYHRQGPDQEPIERWKYWALQPFTAKKDSGAGKTLNLPVIIGLVGSAVLSNSYYPRHQQGVVPTTERAATKFGLNYLGAFYTEFGPDVGNRLFQLTVRAHSWWNSRWALGVRRKQTSSANNSKRTSNQLRLSK